MSKGAYRADAAHPFECSSRCLKCMEEDRALDADEVEDDAPRTRLEWIEATHDELEYPHRGQPE